MTAIPQAFIWIVIASPHQWARDLLILRCVTSTGAVVSAAEWRVCCYSKLETRQSKLGNSVAPFGGAAG